MHHTPTSHAQPSRGSQQQCSCRELQMPVLLLPVLNPFLQHQQTVAASDRQYMLQLGFTLACWAAVPLLQSSASWSCSCSS